MIFVNSAIALPIHPLGCQRLPNQAVDLVEFFLNIGTQEYAIALKVRVKLAKILACLTYIPPVENFSIGTTLVSLFSEIRLLIIGKVGAVEPIVQVSILHSSKIRSF